MQHALQSGATAPADNRGNFIPVRKTDILDALVERGQFADDRWRDDFRQICKVRRDGERISVLPPQHALARLDHVWDNYFQYSGARDGAAGHQAP